MLAWCHVIERELAHLVGHRFTRHAVNADADARQPFAAGRISDGPGELRAIEGEGARCRRENQRQLQNDRAKPAIFHHGDALPNFSPAMRQVSLV